MLDKHGYNNRIYPEKRWVCSEFNIPRRTFGDYIGSEAAQVNFLIKTLVTAQMNDMAQMYFYSIADEKPASKADNEFSYMGLFKNLDGVPSGKAQPNAIAWAMKTTAELLKNARYDPSKTQDLKLPTNVRGAAFRNDLALRPQALPLDLSLQPNGTYYVRLVTPESNLTVGVVKY